MTRTEQAGPSRAGNSSNDGSGFQGHRVDNNSNLSDESGLSEIEQLLMGKKFSRQVLYWFFCLFFVDLSCMLYLCHSYMYMYIHLMIMSAIVLSNEQLY